MSTREALTSRPTLDAMGAAIGSGGPPPGSPRSSARAVEAVAGPGWLAGRLVVGRGPGSNHR
jgi:hypothetical protein